MAKISNGSILDEDMSVITDWTDEDTGTGDSSQVTFDGKSCMKLDTGITLGGLSKRIRDAGTYTTRTVFSMSLYADKIGLRANGDEFLLALYDGTTRLLFALTSDNVYVFNGAWMSIGNFVVQDTWQEWTLDVNWTAKTVDVYLDNVLKASDVDCNAGSGVDSGTTQVQQSGATNTNNIIYIDWIKTGDGFEPSVSKINKKRLTTVIDSETKLLLHCDGTDASTTIPDSSLSAHGNASVFGTAQLDTAQKKFGTASLLLDGNSDYISYSDSVDWYFGTGNFTLDFWIRFNDKTGAQRMMGQIESGSKFWYLEKGSDQKLKMRFYFEGEMGQYIMTNAWSVADNTWYHLAFVRTGTSGLIFINGVSQILTETVAFGSNDVGDNAIDLLIGSHSSVYVNGWMDEFCISKGIERWTSDFIPPTQPYGISEISEINKESLSGISKINNILV